MYLICKKCNGYYKLKENESPEDYDYCQCGGDLILVEDINEYYQYQDYYDVLTSARNDSISKKPLLLFSSCLIIAFMIFLNIFYIPASYDQEISNKFILGSDDRGYVTKEILYQNSSLNTNVIAFVTGIHPREKLSKRVTGDVIHKYASSSNLGIVNYDITVTNNPENYKIGRRSGEDLAADYILSDIKKSNIDLVIICHDHKPGYGSGFYIATPEMDAESVKLADLVNKTLGDFNYYRADNIKEHSTSAIKFSKPLASSGYKTFVYEIPGWENYNKAYNMTSRLLKTCSMFLT
ncbi:MAG: hypothetical protein QMD61_09905 [Methanobacterium sp.]|nr:hypothetical protein [Methanobacterium sp.]